MRKRLIWFGSNTSNFSFQDKTGGGVAYTPPSGQTHHGRGRMINYRYTMFTCIHKDRV